MHSTAMDARDEEEEEKEEGEGAEGGRQLIKFSSKMHTAKRIRLLSAGSS